MSAQPPDPLTLEQTAGRARAARRRRAIAGLGLVAAIVAGIALAYAKPNPLEHKTTVQAVFSDASGIGVVGREVRVAGVPVGEITDRDLDDDGAVVSMEVSDEAGPIHRDASAELRPNLVFEGTAYVDLDPGSPSAPMLGDEPIPVERTSVYVPLDKALRVLQPDTRKAIAGSSAELARTLVPQGAGGLARTIEGAPRLSETLAQAAGAARGHRPQALAHAVRGLSRTTDAVASRSEQLLPAVREADRTLAALDADGGAPLDDSLAALPGTLDSARRGGHALERVVDRLGPLAGELRPGVRMLAPTLGRLQPLVRRARPALRRARPLVADARGLLEAGAGAAPDTERLLGSVDPSLNLLDDSLIPALRAPTEELDIPAYKSFLNLFGGGGGASRPYQSTPGSPGNTGHFMRFGLRFLTGIGAPLPPCSSIGQLNPQLSELLSKAGGCTP